MEIKVCAENAKAEVCAVGIVAVKGEPESILLSPLEGADLDFCRKAVVADKFKGDAGSLLYVPLPGDEYRCAIIVGVGSEDEFTSDSVREAAFAITRRAAEKGIASLSLTLPNPKCGACACAAAEGAVLACYRFDKYVKKEENDNFVAPSVVIRGVSEEDAHRGSVFAEAQCLTRSIANEPANVINPVSLAERAAALADEIGCSCAVWDEDRIQKENMGAYYAVARGSANPPRFIRLTYEPKC
ncbi:MAG: aminopeptidase, partial [Synergistes sp.]|nr:aminopeptidase [Synergistes sp.]